MLLEDKVAIVTGSGRGIGREIALAMVREGARVVVNDIGAALDGTEGGGDPAQQVVAQIEAEGGTAIVNRDTVADPKGARKIVETAMDGFGRVDIVVNNAGILRDTIFHKLSVDDWDAVINVCLNGAFYVSRAAIEVFRKQESGCFVHITSASGFGGNYGQSAYAAAKAGLQQLSKSIAIDAARYNVRSNCLAPSAWTRMTGSIPESETNRERIAQRKKVTPDKNAPMAVFLASDAAAEVTGQIFATRMNEIFLISQPRPIRSVHRSEGWTPQSIIEHGFPALRASMVPLDRNENVFCWDPL